MSLYMPAFATNVEPAREQTTITQFAYVILDADGTVVEQGVTPNFASRYSWSGLVLTSGQYLELLQTNGDGFYAWEGTQMDLSFQFDRNADKDIFFSKNTLGFWSTVSMERSVGRAGTRHETVSSTGEYCFAFRSATSDPITLQSATLTYS